MRKAASPSIPITSLRCEACGATEVACVQPGSAEERALDLFAIARSDPVRAWCLDCATRRGWLEEAAA